MLAWKVLEKSGSFNRTHGILTPPLDETGCKQKNIGNSNTQGISIIAMTGLTTSSNQGVEQVKPSRSKHHHIDNAMESGNQWKIIARGYHLEGNDSTAKTGHEGTGDRLNMVVTDVDIAVDNRQTVKADVAVESIVFPKEPKPWRELEHIFENSRTPTGEIRRKILILRSTYYFGTPPHVDTKMLLNSEWMIDAERQ